MATNGESDEATYVSAARSPLLSVTVKSGVLHIGGEIDEETADVFRQALNDTVSAGDVLVVDLASVPFMDSAGIRALLAARRRRRIRIVRPTERVLTVLDVSGLRETFDLP